MVTQELTTRSNLALWIEGVTAVIVALVGFTFWAIVAALWAVLALVGLPIWLPIYYVLRARSGAEKAI